MNFRCNNDKVICRVAPQGRLWFLLLGGDASYGTHDGLFYGNWDNTASNSNWNIGARSLSAFPFQTDGEAAAYNLAIWRK